MLRRANGDDVATIRDLVHRAYAPWVPVVGREPLPMNADYERAVRAHRIDILEVDRRAVGLIEMVDEPGALTIANVAVDPTYQGNGYGRLLMNHAENTALRLGRPELKLFTNALMTANVAFYGGIGFDVDREDSSMGWPVVFMSKRVGARRG